MEFSKMMPITLEETERGVAAVSLYAKHAAKNRIFLDGEVDDDMAKNFIATMMYYEDLADTGEGSEHVDIILNSPGGSVNAGLVIYDYLQTTPLDVHIYCVGMAASMGAVILAGGQKGKRFILPHSKVMIHEPLRTGGVGGSASSIQQMAESILETRDVLNGILAQHTGKTLEEINKATAFDNYMNATQAIEFGLVDAIVGRIGMQNQEVSL